jgi:DNA-binding MarR family transcriptional regulator
VRTHKTLVSIRPVPELGVKIAAWAALLRVHAALVPDIDRELRTRHGMPLTWYDVLLELNAAPGRSMTMGALGAKATVSRTRVSRVVGELMAEGLVERVPNPDDGRSTLAAITPQGRARLREAAPTYLAAVQRAFCDYLSEDDAATIAAALGRVVG